MLKQKSTFDSNKLVRKNILDMKPYSSARDEFAGMAEIYLDANENPYPTFYNRYPDPHQQSLKQAISKLKGVTPAQIMLGNGSDEPIDLLIRTFCEPYQDSILIAEPTYGMYAVCAEVNAANVQRVLLTNDFDIDLEKIFQTIDASTKLIFICSPNNPSGNLLSRNKIEEILKKFNGLVVIDEAYIDFAKSESFIDELENYSNLVVLQTFSKAWGLAGLRLGVCYASSQIISILNKVKYPYNINSQTQTLVQEALANEDKKNAWVSTIIEQRTILSGALGRVPVVQKVFPSDANFLLVRVIDASFVYEKLLKRGIIVRDRSKVLGCSNCIRITVGTPAENEKLIQALKEL
jgi:histidinol-phosphate aminotransferase